MTNLYEGDHRQSSFKRDTEENGPDGIQSTTLGRDLQRQEKAYALEHDVPDHGDGP